MLYVPAGDTICRVWSRWRWLRRRCRSSRWTLILPVHSKQGRAAVSFGYFMYDVAKRIPGVVYQVRTYSSIITQGVERGGCLSRFVEVCCFVKPSGTPPTYTTTNYLNIKLYIIFCRRKKRRILRKQRQSQGQMHQAAASRSPTVLVRDRWTDQVLAKY